MLTDISDDSEMETETETAESPSADAELLNELFQEEAPAGIDLLEEDFHLLDDEEALSVTDLTDEEDPSSFLEEDFGLFGEQENTGEAPAFPLPEDLDEATRIALEKAPLDRTPQEVELADLARNPDYRGQRSFAVDENGKAIVDDKGEIVDVKWGDEGSQRPDGYMYDGIHNLREAKRYTDLTNLKANIAEQTEKRLSALGEDTDITYVVAPTLTIDEADKLNDFVENDLGQSLEFQLK